MQWFAINGPPGQFVGYETRLRRVAGVGDINDDGYDDIAVGVIPHAADDSILVIFGGPNVAPDGVISIDDLAGGNGFVLLNVGNWPAAGGDLNHDGIGDMVASGVVIFGEPGIGGSGVVDFDEMQDGQHASWFRFFGGLRGPASIGDVNDDGIEGFGRGVSHFTEDLYCDVGKVGVLFGRRMGDGDLDADVDQADFGGLQACFGHRPTATCRTRVTCSTSTRTTTSISPTSRRSKNSSPQSRKTTNPLRAADFSPRGRPHGLKSTARRALSVAQRSKRARVSTTTLSWMRARLDASRHCDRLPRRYPTGRRRRVRWPKPIDGANMCHSY